MNVLVTAEDKQIIAAQDEATLIQWYLALNRWEWPDGLPDEESQDVYSGFMLGNGGAGAITSRRSQLMRLIERYVTQYKILRAHNKEMTDEEFEDFWAGSHEGDGEARERDNERRMESARAWAAKREEAEMRATDEILSAEIINLDS